MKLTSRGRNTAKVELQMTSMIDVVFLLLIFFMITSSFNPAERELDSTIKVQRASLASSSDLQPAIVEIVRGTGGAFVYKLGGREITEAVELTGVLRQFDNKFDGAVVRVEDEAPFDMAANAIQACKNAKFSLVSYVPLDRGR